jgi:magnesium-transporting ATPase (P-type)
MILPLLATQILWINLLTDTAPALAMGVDPQTFDVMKQKPRDPKKRIISGRIWLNIAITGVTMAVVSLIAMDIHLPGGIFTDYREYLTHDVHSQIVMARTSCFTVLVFAQMFNAIASRSETVSAFKGLKSARVLFLSLLLSIFLQVLVIYVPVLNVAFNTLPLNFTQWVECIGLASIVLVVSEIQKFVFRRMDRYRAGIVR